MKSTHLTFEKGKKDDARDVNANDALVALRRAALHAKEKAERNGLKVIVSNEYHDDLN